MEQSMIYDAVLPERATVTIERSRANPYPSTVPARGPRPCPALELEETRPLHERRGHYHLDCSVCEGTGTIPGDDLMLPCDECGGSGVVKVTYDPDGHHDCHHCSGAGTVRVRLTEDPVHHDDDCSLGRECDDTTHDVGWRHVGTVVTDA